MKKFIYITTIIAFAALVIAASCSRLTPDTPEPPGPFTVEMLQTSVHISVSTEGAVSYLASNGKGDVSLTLPTVDGVSLSDEYDPETGRGVIHFSTTSIYNSSVTARFVFDDGTDTVEKDVLIQTSSSWSIEPDDPIEATE